MNTRALSQAVPGVMTAQEGLSPSEFVLEVSERGQKRSYRMLQESLKVGRSADCDIVLNDNNTSRLHAILQRQGDELIILDNNTRNGTYVNGARIQKFSKLKSGDIIQVGATQIVFRRFVKKNQLARAGSTAVAGARAAAVPMAPQLSRQDSFASAIKVTKGKVPTRFIVYGAVLALMTLAYFSGQEEPMTNKIDVKQLEKDPVATYSKLLKSANSNDERNKAMLTAAKQIAESSSQILLQLEANLIKQEQQKYLTDLTNSKEFGAPTLAFKQKLAREHVFSGVREYNFRNYARAEEHFKAALVIEPTLTIAKDYLQSSLNRRRLVALEEYKIATRYFESKRFTSAIVNFTSVRNLLVKDKEEVLDGEWAAILKNCDDYIRLAELAMGKQNIYSTDPRGVQ